MQAVVLAGGLATRMRPRTLAVPKALLEVAGRPFVDWQLERLAACGLPDVVMCVAHLGDQIRAHVGDGARLGVRVVWSFEDDGARAGCSAPPAPSAPPCRAWPRPSWSPTATATCPSTTPARCATSTPTPTPTGS